MVMAQTAQESTPMDSVRFAWPRELFFAVLGLAACSTGLWLAGFMLHQPEKFVRAIRPWGPFGTAVSCLAASYLCWRRNKLRSGARSN
jgi:hypothetical protein